jgi:hypothetical protein
MRINLSQYSPSSSAVQGPIGSTTASMPGSIGTSVANIEAKRDQNLLNLVQGGLEATAAIANSHKKIKDGEDEIRMLRAEELTKAQARSLSDTAISNQDISVGSDADEYTYKVDESLGTYKHQEWGDAENSLREGVINEVMDQLVSEGGEIDEKLEAKLRKRIDISLDSDIHTIERIVLERSGKAVNVAIQKEADKLYEEVAVNPALFHVKRGEFAIHIQNQLENNVINKLQADAWIKKVDEDFSTSIIASYLDSGTDADIASFKSDKDSGAGLWKYVPTDQQIKFTSQLSKIEGRTNDAEMKNLGLKWIDDADSRYAGAGGSLLLDELIGTEGWSFDTETGKVNIKKTDLKSESQFAGTKTGTVGALIESAKKRLESDWKSKNVLSPEDARQLDQDLIDWGVNINKGIAQGWGGTADGYGFKQNTQKFPENFLNNELFKKSKVDKRYPNLTNDTSKLEGLLKSHVNFANKVVNWDISKKKYESHMKTLHSEIIKIKNSRIKAIGLTYYENVNRHFNYRNNVLNNMNDPNKDNFNNIYWVDWARKNNKGSIPGMGNRKDMELRKNLEKRSNWAMFIWLGVDSKLWRRDDYKSNNELMGLLRDNNLPKGEGF